MDEKVGSGNLCYYPINGNHLWKTKENTLYSCHSLVRHNTSPNIQLEIVTLELVKEEIEDMHEKESQGLIHSLHENGVVYCCNSYDSDCKRCEHHGTGDLVRKGKTTKDYQKNVLLGKKVLFCQKCGKGFRRSDQLRFHLFNHSENGKPFRCNVCGEAFVRKTSLHRHAFTHLKKKLECNCSQLKLEDQSIPHPQKKHFLCDFCPQTFILYDELYKHRINHIKKSSLSCDFCKEQFSSKQLLEMHLESCKPKVEETVDGENVLGSDKSVHC